MKEADAIKQIIEEFYRAIKLHEPFNSVHEGIAVIEEEYDELWDEIKKKDSKRDIDALRKEASQVAAMGMRFMVDLT